MTQPEPGRHWFSPSGRHAVAVDAAAVRIETTFGPRLRSTLQVRAGRHRLHLTDKGGGLTLDAAETARRALAGGQVTSVVTARIDAFLDRLERSAERDARDAELRYAVTKLRVSRARDGLRLPRDTAREQIEAAIADPATPRIIRVKLRHLEPDVTRADLVRRHPVVVTVHRRGFKLRLLEDLNESATYPVAVGMPGHVTPTGRYEIANKAVDPAWSAPDRPWAGAYSNEVVPGGSDENPLKARWLGIVDGVGIHGTDVDGVGIHGTDAVGPLGTAASHGCIRMPVADVKALYPRVPVGALVMIK